jgi:hypothetical protein
MDCGTFPYSARFGPASIDSDREYTESEGSSSDEGIVRAQVWAPESFGGNSLHVVTEGDAVEHLLRRGDTKSTVDRRRSGTSLFSERTRR